MYGCRVMFEAADRLLSRAGLAPTLERVYLDTPVNCGSEPARDEGLTFNIYVD